MSESVAPPWDEAETARLFVMLADGSADEIADWLQTNITDSHREYTLIMSIPMWSAIVIKTFMSADEDGFWALRQLRDDTDPIKLGATQMVVAALNDDLDALAGHVEATFELPEERRIEALMESINGLRSFTKIAEREKREATS